MNWSAAAWGRYPPIGPASAERKRITELLRAVGGSVAATAGRKARRALIEARLREHPDWSDRLIANKLGCDGKTVETIRTALVATAEIRPPARR